MARPLLDVSEYVCDFRLLMRARLLFGFYNRLAVPKRYQIAAKLYCFSIFLFFTTVIFVFFRNTDVSLFNTYLIARFAYIDFNILWSIFTEDAHLFSYCTRINLTDVTVDSAIIFSKVEKKVKNVSSAMFCAKILLILLFCALYPNFCDSFNWLSFFNLFLDISGILIYASNFVVFCVFNSRLHLLRLKLERYGFNSRHCRIGINIYCDIYSNIIEELQKRSAIKVAIISEIIFTAAATVCIVSFWLSHIVISDVIMFIPVMVSAANLLAPIFCYCAELESAARQVEAIREFTVTELIKQPCERSRRAMLELLSLTEAAPPHLSPCRAVRVDARLAIAVLSFCSARVILLLQTLRQ